LIEEQVATLPGLDGRKMSKSYDNTIMLFEGGPRRLRETINRIVTDSRAPGEPKDAEGSALFTIFQAFASVGETAAFGKALADGMGWGEAKQVLFERVEADIAPMRERYDKLIAKPDAIEEILQVGAGKARAIAAPMIAELRDAVGLRSARSAPAAKSPVVKGDSSSAKAKPPRFASFRDTDGSFRFRLFAADGEELLLSRRFVDPKAAGALRQRLQTLGGEQASLQIENDGISLMLDGQAEATTPTYLDDSSRIAAMVRLREALDALAAAE
jgi:tryptophanyl-tRNA synthetase